MLLNSESQIFQNWKWIHLIFPSIDPACDASATHLDTGDEADEGAPDELWLAQVDHDDDGGVGQLAGHQGGLYQVGVHGSTPQLPKMTDILDQDVKRNFFPEHSRRLTENDTLLEWSSSYTKTWSGIKQPTLH